MDNDLLKQLLCDLHHRGMIWFTGSLLMGMVALTSFVKLIIR